MQDPDSSRRAMLRGLCLVAGGLAVAIAVIGWLPGYELHREEQHDVVTMSSSPAGLTAVMLIIAGLVACVWRWPSLANALLASMASVGASVFVLALTAAPRLEGAGAVVVLPAAALASQLVLALVVLQIAVVPVACGLLALRARARRAERIARARVHRIGT